LRNCSIILIFYYAATVDIIAQKRCFIFIFSFVELFCLCFFVLHVE